MSLAAVRAGLKTALDPIDGLNVYGYLTLGINTPAAVVGFPEELNPQAVLGPGTDYQIDVAVFVGLADDKIADVTLTDYVEAILTALDGDPDLGGACDSAAVTRVGDFLQAPIGDGGPAALWCLVTVEVFT